MSMANELKGDGQVENISEAKRKECSISLKMNCGKCKWWELQEASSIYSSVSTSAIGYSSMQMNSVCTKIKFENTNKK